MARSRLRRSPPEEEPMEVSSISDAENMKKAETYCLVCVQRQVCVRKVHKIISLTGYEARPCKGEAVFGHMLACVWDFIAEQ
jgi:hypothetical protein